MDPIWWNTMESLAVASRSAEDHDGVVPCSLSRRKRDQPSLLQKRICGPYCNGQGVWVRDQAFPVTVRRSQSHARESVPARPSHREEAIEEEGKRKDRTRWDSNPQPLGPKPNALSVAPRDQGSKQSSHLRPISVDRLHRDEKALREDRTPDLSLTKRVLYRLSY